ncbi:hypothetical protein JTE90_025384 [Oedothorax gibbosus]|uniref:Major facilitator superfamily (MFS) profile domain-containing protein n=1 Tax=Oedothorax gibbosus TaxID=931172 RepID=A0AAV6TUL7_9ARAC|nr:hypothetical protein JTE90_025384 [Oedothorax gibbosus]
MKFEDILQQIGGYGKFQKKLTFLFVIPIYIIIPWFWLSRILSLSVPEHWCHVPELKFSNLSTEEKRKLISPSDDASCSFYNVNYTDMLVKGILKVTNDSEAVPCLNGWEHDTKYYESTAATKFEMYCHYDYLPSLLLTIYIVGQTIGAPLNGYLSDKFGRKHVFFFVTTTTLIIEIAAPLVNHLSIFTFIMLLRGITAPSMFCLPYVLVSEVTPPEMRVNMNGIMNTSWTTGLTILPLIAYLSRDWTVLCYINAGSALFVLAYTWYIPESPCWLLSRGRVDESLKIMMRIAKENGKEQNETELLLHLQKIKVKAEKEKEEENSSKNVMLRYPRLRKHFLILAFCWTSFNVGYNGVTFNTVNLNGNEFVNYFLLGLVEFPSNVLFWYVMGKFGRRWSATAGYFFSGVACLLPVIGFEYSGIISTLIGKFLVGGVIMITDQQAMELIPTVCRSFGMGAGKTVSYIAGLTTPFIAYLSIYGEAIPFVIISATCFIASVLTSFLPETANTYLPQTILEAEEFGRDQKYRSWIRQTTATKTEQVIVSTIEDVKKEIHEGSTR